MVLGSEWYQLSRVVTTYCGFNCNLPAHPRHRLNRYTACGRSVPATISPKAISVNTAVRRIATV